MSHTDCCGVNLCRFVLCSVLPLSVIQSLRIRLASELKRIEKDYWEVGNGLPGL